MVKKEEEETKEEEEDVWGLCGRMLEQFSHKVRRVKPGGGPWSLGISHFDRFLYQAVSIFFFNFKV